MPASPLWTNRREREVVAALEACSVRKGRPAVTVTDVTDRRYGGMRHNLIRSLGIVVRGPRGAAAFNAGLSKLEAKK
jgi:hypothetical protein